MKNIFIAFTPYHVILSCGIALEEGGPAENHLVIISDFSDVGPLIRSLKGWNSSPFAQIECLPGVYSKTSKFKKHLTVKSNLKAITQFVSKHRVDRVYVFHDGRPEAQAALHFAKKGNKSTVGIYVEDGAGAYSSQRVPKRPPHKLLLGKLFYGPWWKDVNVLGTSRWTNEVKAIFPQLVRPELHSKSISPILKHTLLELRSQEWPYQYVNALGLLITEANHLDIVLLVAHSKFAMQIVGYKRAIEEVIAVAKSCGLRLGVKYHPRETLGDFLSAGNAEGILVLPQSLPIELVYMLASERIRFVVGDISTSLLTAKWLLDDITVLSLAPLMGHSDPQLFKTFGELGIDLVDNIVEVASYLADE